ncbi:MAG: MFS transporter [Myxococcota bacterium]|nr:MFS transporter [Myxococcota bacterium]
MPDDRHPLREVLALRDVRNLVIAGFFSGLGRSLLHATIHWHLWKATDSLFYLGLLGLVEFLPVIPVSLVAGAVADNRDRRKLVMGAQGLSLACALVLVLGSLRAEGELPMLLAAAFVLAVASCFQNPARSALMPSLVPRELFPTATVLNSNVRNVAAVSGPVAMGFIAASAGIPAAYLATAVLLGLSVATLVFVRSPEIEGGGRPVSWASVREGVSFVWRQKIILGSITLDMFAVVFASVTALLPVFATDLLGVDEVGYGLLSASVQAGTVAMAVILLALPPILRPGRALLVSVFFFGLATIAFGLTRSFPLALLALAISGMADQVSMVSRSIILQLSTPDALRGRVNAVNMIFIGASNELGAAESGFLASLTSATFSVVFGGLACLGVLAGVTAGIPALRSYRIDEVEEAPSSG